MKKNGLLIGILSVVLFLSLICFGIFDGMNSSVIFKILIGLVAVALVVFIVKSADMKKNGILKILLLLLLLMVVVTYLIPAGGTKTAKYLGIIDVAYNYIQSFYYFPDVIVFILFVGGFYGVLNKTGAYKKLLDNIATKFKPVSKNFVIGTIIVFALIAALTGISVPLFIFIPFVMAIIVLLGYDKLVAFTSTFGATIVGLIGGIFITFRDPSNTYSMTYTTFEKFLKLDSNYVNLFPKILLLVVAVALLVFYVLRYIKNVEDKKVKFELNDKENVKITEVKTDYKKIKVWPLIVVLSVLFVLVILGLVPWGSLFETDVFTKFNTTITGLSIKDFKIFSNVLSTNFVAFGEWFNLGIYVILTFLLLLAVLIIKLIYKIKFEDLINGFVDGIKKILPTVFIVLLAYTVLLCYYNNGFIATIIGYTSKFNVAIAALITLLGSLFSVELQYAVATVLSSFVSIYTDEAVYPVLAILFQSIYGLVSLIAPTSVLLIMGLTYYDIPYITWLKFIWRLMLKLLILILGIILIVTLI